MADKATPQNTGLPSFDWRFLLESVHIRKFCVQQIFRFIFCLSRWNCEACKGAVHIKEFNTPFFYKRDRCSSYHLNATLDPPPLSYIKTLHSFTNLKQSTTMPPLQNPVADLTMRKLCFASLDGHNLFNEPAFSGVSDEFRHGFLRREKSAHPPICQVLHLLCFQLWLGQQRRLLDLFTPSPSSTSSSTPEPSSSMEFLTHRISKPGNSQFKSQTVLAVKFQSHFYILLRSPQPLLDNPRNSNPQFKLPTAPSLAKCS